jgi:hypothetical protein
MAFSYAGQFANDLQDNAVKRALHLAILVGSRWRAEVDIGGELSLCPLCSRNQTSFAHAFMT